MRCSAAYGERWDSELRDRGKDRHHFYFRDVRALFSILYYFRRCPAWQIFPAPILDVRHRVLVLCCLRDFVCMRTRLLVKFGKLAIGVLDGYNSDVCPSSFLPGLASWPGHMHFSP